jgi:lambda family phage minor tail protein L
MTTTALREAQSLQGTAIVELFVLDLTPIEPNLPDSQRILRFSNQLNERGEAVYWQGDEYPAIPIETDGWSLPGRGSLPRPHLRVSNIAGAMTAFCQAYGDLVGAKLTRLRTFERFLPSVNFVNANPDADGSQEFPRDVMQIRQKIAETPNFVEWELAWPGDLQGVMLPRNAVIENVCAWRYKSAECEWSPGAGPYFDIEDQPTNLANDECSLSLTGCKKRFVARYGKNVYLPARIFPGARVPKQ